MYRQYAIAENLKVKAAKRNKEKVVELIILYSNEIWALMIAVTQR